MKTLAKLPADAPLIPGLPLEYKGFIIRQSYERVEVVNPNPTPQSPEKTLTAYVRQNFMGVSKVWVKPIYNPSFTKVKVMLGDTGLGTKFKVFKIEAAKKAIDYALSLGMYWMCLTKREQAYVRANNMDFCVTEHEHH